MAIIDSVKDLSKIEFNRLYYQTHSPVVHKGGIKNLKCFKDWSFNYLKSKIGSRPVGLAYSKQGYYKFYDKDFFEFKTVEFSTAIEYFLSEELGRNYYLQQTSVAQVFPELVEEIELPPCILETDKVLHQNLWIGGSGCVSPLHHDALPNFLAQIKGRKKLVLFSPKDSIHLYPIQEKGIGHMSEVNIRNVDYSRFPLFRKAVPYDCILEPGDVLYIPSGWWHEVSSLDPSITLNYWFLRFDVKDDMELMSIEQLNKQIRILIDKGGVNVNGKDCEGELFLIKAIKKGFTNVLEALLVAGVDPNSASCKYDEGVSAISFAEKYGNQKMVKILLRHGATDDRYATPDLRS